MNKPRELSCVWMFLAWIMSDFNQHNGCLMLCSPPVKQVWPQDYWLIIDHVLALRYTQSVSVFLRVTLNVNSYCCHPPSPTFNSVLSWGILTQCSVLWSTGLPNITGFLTYFTAFLADIMPKYELVLIVGDCNIHVCCPENPLARDFLNIIDSFNLVPSILGPTHERGHTLHLVLSYGLPVLNLEICNAFFLDHMPVLFEAAVCCHTVKTLCHCCSILCSFQPELRHSRVCVRIQRLLRHGFSTPVKLP